PGGFLGLRHAPVFIGDQNNHPAMSNYRGSDELFAPADATRLEGRQQLLAGLEASTSAGGSIRLKQEWGDLHRRACDLVTGPGGRPIFELHREPDRVRDRYGRHPLGQNLLLARRLVEAGAGCVTVSGWVGPSPEGGAGSS